MMWYAMMLMLMLMLMLYCGFLILSHLTWRLEWLFWDKLLVGLSCSWSARRLASPHLASSLLYKKHSCLTLLHLYYRVRVLHITL